MHLTPLFLLKLTLFKYFANNNYELVHAGIAFMEI